MCIEATGLQGIGGSTVLGAPGLAFAANYAYARSGARTNAVLAFNVPQQTVSWQLSYPSTPECRT